MGHTTQRDPIGLAGGVNQYGYAGGDPVNFSDPFGLCKPWPECYIQAAANWGAARGGTLGTSVLNIAAAANGVSEALGTNDLGSAIGDGDGAGIALAAASLLPTGKLAKVAKLAGETGNFRHAVKALGVDKNIASKELHAIKKGAGLKGADNVWINTSTGDVRAQATGEVIGNLIP